MVKKTKMQAKVHKVLHEFKHGELHSGSKHGPEVHSRKQAVAIALNEGRKAVHKINHSHKISKKPHGAFRNEE